MTLEKHPQFANDTIFEINSKAMSPKIEQNPILSSHPFAVATPLKTYWFDKRMVMINTGDEYTDIVLSWFHFVSMA